MKKNSGIFGIFILMLLICGLFALNHLRQVQSAGEADDYGAKAFVDDAIPKIISNWDIDIFSQYLDKDGALKANMTREKMNAISARFRQLLGPFQRYDGSKGEAMVSTLAGKKFISAKYATEAEFQLNKAIIDVGLSKNSGEWKITEFNVHIPVNKETTDKK